MRMQHPSKVLNFSSPVTFCGSDEPLLSSSNFSRTVGPSIRYFSKQSTELIVCYINIPGFVLGCFTSSIHADIL